MRIYSRNIHPFVALFIAGVFLLKSAVAQNEPSGATDLENPASLSDAIAAIDLRTFPRLPKAIAEDFNVHITDLYYEAPGEIGDAIEFYRDKLTADGWKALPVDERAKQAKHQVREYSKDGFHLTLIVSPASTKGHLTINVTNFGSLDVRKLPHPDDAEATYSSGQYVDYRSKLPAKDALDFVRKRLGEAGWTEVRYYYETEDADQLKSQHEFIKNATCITVYPSRKRGGSQLRYGCRMLKFNAPILADSADAVMNDDQDFSLTYETQTSASEALEFYQSKATEFGWKMDDERSEVGDRAGQLHFLDTHTDQSIVVTIVPGDADQLKIAIEGTAADSDANSDTDTTQSNSRGDADSALPNSAMNTPAIDQAQVLIEAQRQIVEQLKAVDPERAKEVEAELQKMIDAMKDSEDESADQEDDEQSMELAVDTFPIPDGSRYIERDSDSELIKYFADLKIQEYAKFYRECLSKRGWKESPATMLDGYARLEFEKDDRSIEISLIQDDTEGGMMVTIKGDGVSWNHK